MSLPQDVLKLGPSDFDNMPPVDLIMATPPCMPFSTAGGKGWSSTIHRMRQPDQGPVRQAEGTTYLRFRECANHNTLHGHHGNIGLTNQGGGSNARQHSQKDNNPLDEWGAYGHAVGRLQGQQRGRSNDSRLPGITLRRMVQTVPQPTVLPQVHGKRRQLPVLLPEGWVTWEWYAPT